MSRTGGSLLARLASRYRSSSEVLATHALWTILTAHHEPRQAFEQLLVRFGIAPDFAKPMMLRQEYVVDADNRIDIVGQLADGRLGFALEAKWNSTELRSNQTNAYHAAVAPWGLLLYVVPQRRLKMLSDHIGREFQSFKTAKNNDYVVLREANDGKAAIVVCSWEYLLDTLERGSSGMAAEDVRQLRGMCGDAGQLVYQPFTVDWNEPSLRQGVAQAIEIAADIFAAVEQRFPLESVYQATDETTSIGWYFEGVPWAGWFGFEPIAWAYHGQTPLWIAIPLQYGSNKGTRAAMEKWHMAKGLKPLTHRYTTENFIVPVPLVGGLGRDEVIAKALQTFDALHACYPNEGPAAPCLT